MSDESDRSHDTRAGIVALVGRPNAGKSTLLNALVGERLSIVTSKAQTTWRRVTGIRSAGATQMIFLDTPGLLEVRDLLQRSMLEEARDALRDADAVLLVLDATHPVEEARRAFESEVVPLLRAPLVVAINKCDVASPDAIREAAAWAESTPGARVFRISAARGDGLDALVASLEALLPVSPFLYDPDDLATQPMRFFVAELVRETVFEQFEQEIPYSVFCTVEEFEEAKDPLYIRVRLLVERTSQKAILIGEGGRAIRELGIAARAKIEDLVGRRIYLDLWVKTLPGWRRRRGHLERLGFHVPADAAQGAER